MRVDYELAKRLFPKAADVVAEATAGTPKTSQVRGYATADSSGGSVTVLLDAEAGGSDAEMEVPTSGGITAGSDVLVTLLDGTPVDCAQAGSIDTASTLATQAAAVANATGQHFWEDADGAHVTEVTKDEWNDSGDANYHSGANSLWNSLGMIFRNGLTNLLAVLTSGIAIYDGNGNNADNILAEFTSNAIRIAKGLSWNVDATAKVEFFDGLSDLTVENHVYRDGNDALTDVAESAALSIESNSVPDFYGEGRTDYYGSGNSNVTAYVDLLGGYVESGVLLVPDATAPDNTNIQSFEDPLLGIRGYAVASGDPFGTGMTSEYNIIAAAHTITAIDSSSGGDYGTFDMGALVKAMRNAGVADSWASVTAGSWISLGSGWSIADSTLTYNALRKRFVGYLNVKATASHSSGNNTLGTVKSDYRPPARVIIDTTTNGAYKIYVDGSGTATIVLGSAASSGTNFWFAMDYPVA